MEQDLILRITNVIILIWVVYKAKKVVRGIECMHDTVHVIEEDILKLSKATHTAISRDDEGDDGDDNDDGLDLVQEWDNND